MTIKQDIDKLFERRLSNYSEQPPAFVWDNINNQLNTKRIKKKRTIIYSIAASIAILLSFSAGYFFTNNLKPQSTIANYNKNIQEYYDLQTSFKEMNRIEKTNSKNQQNNISLQTNKTPLSSSNEIKTNSKQSVNNKPIVIASNKKQTTNTNKKKHLNKEKRNKPKRVKSSGVLTAPVFASSENFSKKDSPSDSNISMLNPINIIKTQTDNATTLELKEMNLSNNYNYADKHELQNSPWSVGVSAAPLFSYRSTQETNYTPNTDITTDYNNEKPLTSFSTGVNINYGLGKRWRIKSGFYYSQTGQVSDNITFTENTSIEDAYSINTSAGNLNVTGRPDDIIAAISPKTTPDDTPLIPGHTSTTPESIETELVQSFDFYEIPLMIGYTLLNKKLTINISGGFSANILNKTNSYVMDNNFKYDLNGDIEGIKSMNYSSLLGMGFEYPIVSRLRFNLQPTFRYSLTTISNSGTSYPYSFGIYTGLRYSFK